MIRIFGIRLDTREIFALAAFAALVAAAVAYHYVRPPASALASRPALATKVPQGWYAHQVELKGAPPPTLIVLTKQPLLPVRNASDAPYDDPQITVTSATIPGSPESYVEHEGLSGENAEVMGIEGIWSTFMGHKMFAIDIDQVGSAVMLFGGTTVYSFTLSTSDLRNTGDFWSVITYYAQPALYAGTEGWKTYTDPSTGFTMKYPPQYAVETYADPTTPWGSRTLLQIYDPASTATGEFQVGPMQVTLEKQPVAANGTVYDTIVAYQKGVAAQMVQGAPNPKGDLMTIASGAQGLFYSFPANVDTGSDPIDSYFFIKNTLIYEASFDANDPYEQGMLESITL